MTEQESKALIATLYVSLFGRAPDPSGLAFWSAGLQNGGSYTKIIGTFLESPEGSSIFGASAQYSSFVTAMYQNILNRVPDTQGVKFWTDRLSSTGERAKLIEDFISIAKAGSTTDSQLIANRVDFGLSFAASKSGDNISYAKALLANVTSDPASLSLAKLVNEYIDNPPVVAPVVIPPVINPPRHGAAPTLALHADTGILNADGVTKNGTIDVTIPTAFLSWEYNIKGAGWTVGLGAGSTVSFGLVEGVYGGSDVQVRYMDASNVVSTVGHLGSGVTVDTTAPVYLGNTVTVSSGSMLGLLDLNFSESIYARGSYGGAANSTSGGQPVVLTSTSSSANHWSFDIHGNFPIAGTYNAIISTGAVQDLAGNQASGVELVMFTA